MVDVRLATEADATAWDRFVISAGTPPTATWSWARLLQAVYPVEAVPLIAVDGGATTGALLAYVSGRGMKRVFSPRHALLAKDEQVAAALMAALCHESTEAQTVEVTSGLERFAGLEARAERTTVLLPLAATEDEMWATLRGKTRNMVRKGQRSELTAEWGWGGVARFWDVYRKEMVAKGISFHRRAFFPRMADALGDRAGLLTVRAGDRIVGGTVVLFGDRMALYPYQSALRETLGNAPNQLMIWEIVRECIRRGVPLLDMGEATPGGSTFRFKVNFGGDPTPVHYYSCRDVPKSPLLQASAGVSRPARRRLRGRVPAGLWRFVGSYVHGRGRVV